MGVIFNHFLMAFDDQVFSNANSQQLHRLERFSIDRTNSTN